MRTNPSEVYVDVAVMHFERPIDLGDDCRPVLHQTQSATVLSIDLGREWQGMSGIRQGIA